MRRYPKKYYFTLIDNENNTIDNYTRAYAVADVVGVSITSLIRWVNNGVANEMLHKRFGKRYEIEVLEL